MDGREHCKSFKARPLADGFLDGLKDAVGDQRPCYAHCIDGQADAANQRITDALGATDPDSEPGPGGEEHDDGEQAS